MRLLFSLVLSTLLLASAFSKDETGKNEGEAALFGNPVLVTLPSVKKEEPLFWSPRREGSIAAQDPSKELRVHLVQAGTRSSHAFVRAKFVPGEVRNPWAVQFVDDTGRVVPHFVWDSVTWKEARDGPSDWGGQGRYALLNHAAGDGPGVREARFRRIEWAEKNIPDLGAKLRAQEEAAGRQGESICTALYLLKYTMEPFGKTRLVLKTGVPFPKGDDPAPELAFDGSAFTWKGKPLFQLAGFEAGGHKGAFDAILGSRATRRGIVTKTSFHGQTTGLSWKRTYWLFPEGCFAGLEEFAPKEEGYVGTVKPPGQRPSIWQGDLSIVREPSWTAPWWTLKAGSSFVAVHLFHHVPLASGYGNNPFTSNPEGRNHDPSLQPAGEKLIALDWPFATSDLGFLFVARPGLAREVMSKGKGAPAEKLAWRADIDWCSRQYLAGVGSTEEEAGRALQQVLSAAAGWIDRPFEKKEIQSLIVKEFLAHPPGGGGPRIHPLKALPEAIRGDREAAMRLLRQGEPIDKHIEMYMNWVTTNAKQNADKWGGRVKDDTGRTIGEGWLVNPAYYASQGTFYLRILEHFGLDYRVRETRDAFVRWAEDTLRLFGGEEKDLEKFRAAYLTQWPSRVVMLVPLMLRAYRETKDEKYAKVAAMIFDDIMALIESNPRGYWDSWSFRPSKASLYDSVYNGVTYGRGLTDFWAEGALDVIGRERASRLSASQARVMVYYAQLLDSLEMDSATAVAAHQHGGHPGFRNQIDHLLIDDFDFYRGLVGELVYWTASTPTAQIDAPKGGGAGNGVYRTLSLSEYGSYALRWALGMVR
jgi:hypothetical protein